MYCICSPDGEQDHTDCQDVHRQAVTAERPEETGSHLEADGENEKDQAEFLDERQHYGIHAKAEMPEKDTHKKNPDTAERQPFYLELAQEQAGGYYQGENENCPCGAALCQQFFHHDSTLSGGKDIKKSLPCSGRDSNLMSTRLFPSENAAEDAAKESAATAAALVATLDGDENVLEVDVAVTVLVLDDA